MALGMTSLSAIRLAISATSGSDLSFKVKGETGGLLASEERVGMSIGDVVRVSLRRRAPR